MRAIRQPLWASILSVVALSAASCGGACDSPEMIEPPAEGTIVKLFFDDGEFLRIAKVTDVDLPGIHATDPQGNRLVVDWRHVRAWSTGEHFDQAWAQEAK